jgi:hypothetical protein
MGRVRAAGPKTSKQIRLVRAIVDVTAVEYFANFDAATEQVFPGGLDIRDSQV